MSLFSLKNEPKDVELANPPTDGISSLAWSPAGPGDFLAVGSWSNEVRIYEVREGGANEGRAAYTHEAPVLCCTWSKDGSKIVSGGADNAARLFDTTTGQTTQFGAHDAPVRCIEWVDAGSASGIVCTGSWDKTFRYWDLRQPSPIAQVQLPERCYTMSCVYPLLVVGTAGCHIQVFNLTNPTVPFKSLTSPLRMQTRALSCFPDATGFALSSMEGRVAIQHVDDSKSNQNFSFKTCRNDLKPLPGPPFRAGSTSVYSVNALSFHPFGTFVTAGANGGMNIWDHYSRTRLKNFPTAGGPISATGFSQNGKYLAYAVSYDWSKGHSGNVSTLPNKVLLHACQEDEVKRRDPSKKK
ncbi:hypothetical protein JCM6882_006446 [Rhodosporidiobolus microsporus]